MRDKTYRGLYKELAEKYGLPVEVIEKITDSQFEFCKTVISSGGDEPIRLQYLGLFRVKDGRRALVAARIARLKKIRDEKRRQAEQRDDLSGREEAQQEGQQQALHSRDRESPSSEPTV